jgi:hypothetical protein
MGATGAGPYSEKIKRMTKGRPIVEVFKIVNGEELVETHWYPEAGDGYSFRRRGFAIGAGQGR